VSGAALAGGYVADAILGDPRTFHPVAGFGQLAQRVERAVYAPTRARGIAYTTLLVGLAAAGGEASARVADRAGVGRPVALALATWTALGGRSLTRAAGRLADDVASGDLVAARQALPHLCGRDAEALDAAALTRAALESVAENTTDAVVAVLLWGAAAGSAGVLGYRAANTLDAMVGHRNDRYGEFGWASARLDDAVNWPASWLAAMLTALCAPLVGGSAAATWKTVRRDGAKHPSSNAGRIEAAFAGALDLRLGGPLAYAGVGELRPLLGTGRPPTPADVLRANRLSASVGGASLVVCAAARALVLAVRRTQRHGWSA
jgi:adenosylcobinamide-phosphate synthase